MRIEDDTIYGYNTAKVDCYENLGCYKSEKRAEEILDEIDEIKFYKYMADLDIEIFTKIIKDKYSEIQQLELFKKMNTYDMPKE